MKDTLTSDEHMNTNRNIQLWVSLYHKAAQLEIQAFDYAMMRRYLRDVDQYQEPLELDDVMPGIPHDNASVVQSMLASLSNVCHSGIIGAESVRVLFRKEGRSLHPFMYVAHKLNVRSDNADDPIHIVGCGMLTACDFVEDDALGTRGTARVLEEKGIDLEEALLVDIVCSKEGSRSGRALLAHLLLRLKRQRGEQRKSAVVTVTVTNEGRRLFESFGFSSRKRGDGRLMYAKLSDIRFQHFVDSLLFEGSKQYLEDICFRPGLTSPTKNKKYTNGCST